MRVPPRRRPAADRPEPAAATVASSWGRADPGPGATPDRADPKVPAPCLQAPAPAAGTAGLRAAAPAVRSAAGTDAQASVRRSPNPRSQAPRSSGRRCPAYQSGHSRRPGYLAAARSDPPAAGATATGLAGAGLAGAASLRGASAIGRTRLRRHCPARSGPRRHRGGRRGDRPGVFAWAGHRHRGRGRYRHVPPGSSWTLVSSRAAGQALPDECRSEEVPCRTRTTNCHQLHIIVRY
jgi:translation initiation factor IF-2